MELLSIKGTEVTIRLNPRDCLRLAQACGAADASLGGGSVGSADFGLPAGVDATPATVDLQQMYAGLAAFFLAACVASWDHYEQPDWSVAPERIARADRNLLTAGPSVEAPAAL